MELHLRLDERLIHGQITTQWSRALDITMILVANDRAEQDPLLKNMLLMARPADKKVAIKSVKDSIRLLQDPRAEKMKVLIIVDNPSDAIELIKNLSFIDVNIANYTKKKGENKIRIAQYCTLDEEDYFLFKELCDIYPGVFSQMVPTSEKEMISTLLNK